MVLALVGLGLFGVADFLMPPRPWRTITECLVVVLMFSAMARWARANRAALARTNERTCEHPPLEIRYITSMRYPANERHQARWRAEAKRRRWAPAGSPSPKKS